MAAASSIQPPIVHSSLTRDSALSPDMDSPERRQPEDEEATAAAAQPSESCVCLRDLPDLEPEEIERRLAKTRRELSNRRKILIKNLPPDTSNQVWKKSGAKSNNVQFCFEFLQSGEKLSRTPVCINWRFDSLNNLFKSY